MAMAGGRVNPENWDPNFPQLANGCSLLDGLASASASAQPLCEEQPRYSSGSRMVEQWAAALTVSWKGPSSSTDSENFSWFWTLAILRSGQV